MPTETTQPKQPPLRPPSPFALLREGRVALDLAGIVLPLLNAKPVQSSRPRDIMVLPGFASSDVATWPLRRYLSSLGHRVEGWKLGRNRAGADIKHGAADIPAAWDFRLKPGVPYRGEASVVMLCDRVLTQVRERSQRVGKPITLIGWSLGGYIAREVARQLENEAPDCVELVITLGSPVIGGPKYTAAAPFFRLRGQDLEWIEQEIARRNSKPLQTPITAIISTTDGIVAPAAARDVNSANLTVIEVDAAHFGLGVNAAVWGLVVEALEG